MTRACSVVVRALAALALAHGAAAHAHNLSTAHVDLVVDPADKRHLTVELDLSLRDLALTLPLDANRDEQVTWGELQAARPALEGLVASGFSIRDASGPCRLVPTALATRRYDDGVYATLVLDAECRTTGPFAVDYALFFDRDPEHRAMLTLRDGARSANGLARAGGRTVPMDTTVDHAFLAFLREGVHHILIGYDHIAFLISLILPALLVWNGRRWVADTGVRPRLLQVFWLATSFTVAHSVTLTLASLGWVTPSFRWVEGTIAASVVLAALNNIRPVVVQRLWVLSFVFGLVHGFGFAGALSEIGLPGNTRFLALLGFNFGVEVGQLALLCVLLPLLVWLRKDGWYARWGIRAASWAIAGVACWWLVERVV